MFHERSFGPILQVVHVCTETESIPDARSPYIRFPSSPKRAIEVLYAGEQQPLMASSLASVNKPPAIVTNNSRPITNFKSVSTQTSEDGNVSVTDLISCHDINHIIAAMQSTIKIPTIEIRFGYTKVKSLLDTGSSISIIDKDLFDNVKHRIKHKFLSRRVQITTLNSSVNFIGCVDAAFKINNLYFRHPLYIIKLQEHSHFKALLGFDFVKMHNFKIVPQENICMYKDVKIPFNTPEENKEESLQTNKSAGKVDLTNIIDVSPFVPRSQKSSMSSAVSSNGSDANSNGGVTNEPKVYSINEIYLTPQESAFIKVKSFPKVNKKLRFLFSSSNSNKYSIDDTIIEFPFEDLTGCASSNQSIKVPICKTFYILIKNISDTEIKIKEHEYLGNLHEIDNIEEDDKNLDRMTDEFVNAIQASEEIKRMRQEEFKNAQINLSHMAGDERDKLHQVLSKNCLAFSSSMSTLGHSDHIKHVIKFNSDCPIKAIPFPVPYALQEETRSQLNALEEAGIIQKNIASWAAPMLLVKKEN